MSVKETLAVMRLPVASCSFAVLALVCAIAYTADSGRAFFWLSVVCVCIALGLLVGWVWDVAWFYHDRRQRQRAEEQDDQEDGLPPGTGGPGGSAE